MRINRKAREEWEKKQAEVEKLRKLNEVSYASGIFPMHAFLLHVCISNLCAYDINLVILSLYRLTVILELMVTRRRMMVVINLQRYLVLFLDIIFHLSLLEKLIFDLRYAVGKQGRG